jgi:hypothetical protein
MSWRAARRPARHAQALRAQGEPLVHAEALLLVDDGESQVRELELSPV